MALNIAIVVTVGAIFLNVSPRIALLVGLALWAAGVFVDGASTRAFLKKGYEEANVVFNFLLKKLGFGRAIVAFVFGIELPVALLLWLFLGKPASFAMIGTAHLLAGLENYGVLK